jgi:hypothetical protein
MYTTIILCIHEPCIRRRDGPPHHPSYTSSDARILYLKREREREVGGVYPQTPSSGSSTLMGVTSLRRE